MVWIVNNANLGIKDRICAIKLSEGFIVFVSCQYGPDELVTAR